MMTKSFHRFSLTVMTLFAFAAVAASAAEVDSAREKDPEFFDRPAETVFSPKLKPLWLAALDHPEVDMKRRIAQTIAVACERGMRGLDDMVEPLLAILEADEQHPVLRLTVARTLIVLDARSTAEVLAKYAASDGFDMRQLVEPALARWDYEPIREVWLKRLEDGDAPHAEVLLAVRGLATVAEPEAVPHFHRLALDRDAGPDLRMEVAKSLGELQREGLEDDSRRLAFDEPTAELVDQLVATFMVRHHAGEAAETLLLEMAAHEQPAIAASALARLLEIDPLLVRPLNEQIAASPDSTVRALALKVFRGQEIPEAVVLLGELLDDPHPEVRAAAQKSLIELASIAELDGPVREATMKMLTSERHYGLEQAALVVGALDHEPAADRLVELLEFEAPTVYITAAWALREIRVPATVEPIMKKLRHETDRTAAITARLDAQFAEGFTGPFDIPPLRDLFKQTDQLIQALGLMQAEEADPYLREFFPKPRRRGDLEPPDVSIVAEPELRSSAMWALGHLYKGNVKEDLVALLQGRVTDASGSNPEVIMVRAMAAVSLARMGHRESIPLFEKYAEQTTVPGRLDEACEWALNHLTGKPIPPLEPYYINEMRWFLQPLEY